MKEQWALGNFTARTIEETTILNAEALGQVQNLEKILDMSYNEFSEGLLDEK